MGVTGGCPDCSLALARLPGGIDNVTISEAINHLIQIGSQVINLSLGDFHRPSKICHYDNPESTYYAWCTSLALAELHDVTVIAAAGNNCELDPDFPASVATVLSVGGLQANGSPITAISRWDHGNFTNLLGQPDCAASNFPGFTGVLAPAKHVVSTVATGSVFFVDAAIQCTDQSASDQSGLPNDGYGSCTGTSMAAPHVSALAGLLRSTAPLVPASVIRDVIRVSSGVYYANEAYGFGVPNAGSALDILTTQVYPWMVTPLFAFYSPIQEDYFYTTIPQMGAAAVNGTLKPTTLTSAQPGLYETVGSLIPVFSVFPGNSVASPRAQVYLFTTPQNPVNTEVPLAPLYRLSWKCNGVGPVCTANPNHVDFTYTADPNGVSHFESLGYSLDGIEGYVFPNTAPQPPGSVKLMRKYHPGRDDFAIFPETELANMQAQGYTWNGYSLSDTIGYVYAL